MAGFCPWSFIICGDAWVKSFPFRPQIDFAGLAIRKATILPGNREVGTGNHWKAINVEPHNIAYKAAFQSSTTLLGLAVPKHDQPQRHVQLFLVLLYKTAVLISVQSGQSMEQIVFREIQILRFECIYVPRLQWALDQPPLLPPQGMPRMDWLHPAVFQQLIQTGV